MIINRYFHEFLYVKFTHLEEYNLSLLQISFLTFKNYSLDSIWFLLLEFLLYKNWHICSSKKLSYDMSYVKIDISIPQKSSFLTIISWRNSKNCLSLYSVVFPPSFFNMFSCFPILLIFLPHQNVPFLYCLFQKQIHM